VALFSADVAARAAGELLFAAGELAVPGDPPAALQPPMPKAMPAPQKTLPGRAGVGAASGPYRYWNMSGLIDKGGVTFDPLFVMTSDIAANSTGQGTHLIEVQDSAGAALFDRSFTPMKGVIEGGPIDPGYSMPLTFTAIVPVMAGAARIVVKDPAGIVLGTLTLAGAAPVVAITRPSAGFVGSGNKTVSWTIHGADSATFTSRVLYSPDNGLHWSGQGDVSGTSMVVDFDRLGGSNGQSLIQVLVSDGVNTGSATSLPFTVPRKPIQFVQIDFPERGAVQPAADTVSLNGYAYDPDDGMLVGPALQWSSDIQGPLGQGEQLEVSLKPGKHKITLKATDSDGNSRSASTSILIGGGPPVVSLRTAVLDRNPSTCVEATISAVPASDGAPLSEVTYSLDGGVTDTKIPLTKLPYKFVVPGSGAIHIVAWANDTSGQGNGQDTVVHTQAVCQQGTPAIEGKVLSKGLQSPGVYFVDVQFTNSGAGLAPGVSVTGIVPKVLSGTGSIVYTGPALPLALGGLTPGKSATAHLLFRVPNPNTITRFSLTGNGTLSDVTGRSLRFSIGQSIIP
jgi:hypothetical protein